MIVVGVPYHLDERLPVLEGDRVDVEVSADLPPGDRWSRMAVLYEQVARTVSEQRDLPVVVSGDCTTSLGVLTGLQRAGRPVGVVWLDAHADFHTEDTTTSGYLGGMPLALAAGVGALTLPEALGLRPVPEDRIVLVDARDTDPGEAALLRRSAVRRTTVQELSAADLPAGELYLHVDLDVADPADVPDLLYPTGGGPCLDDVLAAVGRVVATGRVAAVGVGTTWRQGGSRRAEHEQVLRRLVQAVSGTTEDHSPAAD